MLNYDNQEALSSQNSFVKVSVFEFFLFPGASFLFALNASIKTNKSVVNEGRKLILIPPNRGQVINHFQRIPIPREVDDSERLPSRVSTSWAQLNLRGHEFVFAKFCVVLKNHLAANLILSSIWVRGWGKMGHGRARVSAPGWVRAGDAKWVR